MAIAINKRSSEMLFKFLILLGIMVGMDLPLSQINALLIERMSRRDGAVSEVARMAGGPQRVAGPFVLGSLTESRVLPSTAPDQEAQVKTRQRDVALPLSNMTVSTTIEEMPRNRGLYTVQTYVARVVMQGEFTVSHSLTREEKTVAWNRALLAFRISDATFLDAIEQASWNGNPISAADWTEPNIIALELPLDTLTPDAKIPFSLTVLLRGSGSIHFAPTARSWDLRVQTNANTPSFVGDILPVMREVTNSGTTAQWRAGAFASNFNCSPYCSSTEQLLQQKAPILGISFLPAVESYTKIYRAVKYQSFFLLFTFAVYILFELVAKARLHPIQYFFVGCALTLFYLFLLAFAEHIGFSAAYGLATVTLGGIIVGYSHAILRDRRQTALIGSLIFSLYGFFYSILLEQDFALLYGSLGLTVALGTLMYVTRNVNWYAVGASGVEAGAEGAHPL